jgi:N-formylglutamate amidohydrolase
MRFDPFILYEPAQLTSSIVFATPHSGRNYPQDFLDRIILDAHAIRASEDAFVDQLFLPVTEVGAPLLAALVPRAFVDLNRSCEELDPALIGDMRSAGSSARVTSGLGVVPRVVAAGRPIYHGKISMVEAQARLQDVWHPYHQRLQALLDATRTKFGHVVLIDCHSMPHEATNPGLRSKTSPEIVVGDRFGAAADPKVVECVQAAFADAGFRVSRNVPFAGAYISQHYGKPKRGQHVIQIEIDRSLYLDEASIKPLASFVDFQTRLRTVIEKVAAVELGKDQIAAE